MRISGIPLLLLLSVPAGAATPAGVPATSLTPAHGKPVAFGKLLKGKLLVLVTGSSHCPILRQYVPTLNELSRKWKARGVSFVLVDEADRDDRKTFREEFKAFSLAFPAYLDEKQELVATYGLDVSSKVAVIDVASGKAIYSGAIDDSITFEGRKPGAKEATLDSNLEAALAGRALPYPNRGAVGCAITVR